MRDTEVLLREHVKNLGKCGDIVRVKAGFARNYLLPRGIATFASEDTIKAMARKRERLDAEEAALLADLDARIRVMQALALKTIERADDHGHLFGSVNAQRIVQLLGDAGQTIEERAVRLEKPIKSVGMHEVVIHLHAERSATVKIEVEAEGAAEKAAQEAADAAAKAAGKAEAKAAAEGDDENA
ncbi:MAG: 50S ribosomal protein L9 [Planctomycetes bacterium]|nr:50S ribosomal protein L9 [Planctomycetota bacterium]